MVMEVLPALLLGYVLGSVPFGVILTRLFGAGDLHSIGSGGTGATNVLRTGRKGLAAATLVLDLSKGIAAVVIARAMWPGVDGLGSDGADLGGWGAEGWAGLFAVIGHCYPIWLYFRGGKGVATLMGVALGLVWPIGLVFAAVWLGMLAVTRISSLGGMSAAVAAPIAALVLGWPQYALALTIMAAIVLWRHRENIRRLIAGTEPRVGAKT